jgi:hypothetical protein
MPGKAARPRQGREGALVELSRTQLKRLRETMAEAVKQDEDRKAAARARRRARRRKTTAA